MKKIGDYKVLSGTTLDIKDWMVFCRMTLETKKSKLVKAKARIKCWKLKKDKRSTEFRKEL